MNDTPGYVKNLKKGSVVQSVINCLTDAMRNKELNPARAGAGRVDGRCPQFRT